jgi:alkylated DNA nucleotide flippase Atl1
MRQVKLGERSSLAVAPMLSVHRHLILPHNYGMIMCSYHKLLIGGQVDDTAEIWARFARRMAGELERLSDDLLALGAEAGTLATEPLPLPDEELLGARQRQIAQVPGLLDEEGMKTADIARTIDYEVPNTYTTLQALAGRGIVEQIPGATPQRWRLHYRYRATASPYLRMASHVRQGEWTTYGDVSIAVRGDTNGARAVGRAAATLDSFPNPHRLLAQGGVIPPGWRSGDGHGPEECERRLRAEGVEMVEGRAQAERRVTWDILVARDEEQGAGD